MSVVKYNFKWPSGPNDVVVTGEFDEWRGMSHLKKSATSGEFETTLPLRIPEVGDGLHFKFIVDGQWTTSGFYKIGTDTAGNENNFIPKHELRSLAMKKSSRGGNGTITGKKSNTVPRHSSKDGDIRRNASPPSIRNENHPHVSNHHHRYDHGHEGRDGYERDHVGDRVSANSMGGVHPESNRDASFGAANAGPIVAAEFLDLFADNNDPALKKVKIKRKIKRNKKTGERIVVSEEKIPLDNDYESFWVSTGDEENLSEIDGHTGGQNLANAAAGVASNSARQRHQPYVLPGGGYSNPPVTPPSIRRSRPVSTTGIPKSSQQPSGLLRSTSFTKERPASTIGVAGSSNRPKSSTLGGNTSRGSSRKKSYNGPSASNVDEGKFHTLPVEHPPSGEDGTFISLSGEPGPFIPTTQEQLSAFNEVNDNIDPKAFNERLNDQYKTEDSKTSGRRIEKDKEIEKLKDNEDVQKLGKDVLHGKAEKKDPNDTLKKDGGKRSVSGLKGDRISNDTGTARSHGTKIDTKGALGKLSKDDNLKQLGKDTAQGKVNKDDAVKRLGKDSTVKDVGKNLASAAKGGNGAGSAGSDGVAATNTSRRTHMDTGVNSPDADAGMKAKKNSGATKDAFGKLSKDDNLKQLGKDTAQGKVNKDDAVKRLGKDSTVKDVGKNLASATKGGDGASTAGSDGVAATNTSRRTHTGMGVNSPDAEAGMKAKKNSGATKDAFGKLSKDDDLKQLGKEAAQGKVSKDDALKKLGKDSTVKDVGKNLASAAKGGDGAGSAGSDGVAATNTSRRTHTGMGVNSADADAGMKTNGNSGAKIDTKGALGKLSKDDNLKQLGKDTAQGKVNKDDAVKRLGKDSTVKDVGKNLASAAKGGDGAGTAGGDGVAATNASRRTHTGMGVNSPDAEAGMKSKNNGGTAKADTKEALGKLSKDDDLKQLGKEAAQGKVSKDDALKKLGKDATAKDVGKNLASDVAKGGVNNGSGAIGLAGKEHNTVLREDGTSGNPHHSGSRGEPVSNAAIDDEGTPVADLPNVSTKNEDIGLGSRRGEAYVTSEKAGSNERADWTTNRTSPSSGGEGLAGIPKQKVPKEVKSNDMHKKGAVKGGESRKKRGMRPTLDPRAEENPQEYGSRVDGRSPSRQYRNAHRDGDQENEVYLDPLNNSSSDSRHVPESNTGPFNSRSNDVSARRSATGNAAGTAAEKDAVKTGKVTASPAKVTPSNAAGNAANVAMGKDAVKTSKVGAPPSRATTSSSAVRTGKVASSPSRGRDSSNGKAAKTNRRSLSIPFVRRNKSVNSKAARPKSISGAVDSSESKANRPKKGVISKGNTGGSAGSHFMSSGDAGFEGKEKQARAEAEASKSKDSKEGAPDLVKSGSSVQNGKSRTEDAEDVFKQGGSGKPDELATSGSKEIDTPEKSKATMNAASSDPQSPQSAAQSAAANAVNNAEKKRKFSIWAKVKRALL